MDKLVYYMLHDTNQNNVEVYIYRGHILRNLTFAPLELDIL